MHKGLRRRLKFYHIRIELGIYFVNRLRITDKRCVSKSYTFSIILTSTIQIHPDAFNKMIYEDCYNNMYLFIILIHFIHLAT